MAILTETFEGTPQGMNVFIPAQELPDTQARYMQDILVDYPGLVRRRGPVRQVSGSVSFTNKVSGIVQTLDPNGSNRIAVLNGSASLGYLSMLSDLFNTKTDVPLVAGNAAGFPLTSTPPANPYSIVDAKQALGGGALIGISTHYGIPTRQALIHWRGSRKDTYGTGTVTAAHDSTSVTGSGTSWLANVEPGSFLFADGTPGSLAGVVKSVDSNTTITLEKASLVNMTAAAYSIQPLRGLSIRCAKGRITTDTTSAIVTGALTKFRDWGLDGSWNLYRLSDMKYIGNVSSVQSNTGLTLGSSATVSMSNERYIAVKFNDTVPISTLTGNRLGFLSAVYAERQWYANRGSSFVLTTRLWFSDPQDFEAVDFAEADGDYIKIGQGRDGGQPIRALAPAYNALLVLKDNVSYAVRGSGPSSFSVNKLMDDGTLSGMSVQNFGGGVVWAGKDGIYFYDGVQVNNLTAQNLADFYKNMVRGFDPSKYRMWSMVAREHYFLFIEAATPNIPTLKGTKSTTPNTMCIVINMPTRAITTMQNVNMRGSIQLPADTGESVWYVVNGYPSALATQYGYTSITSHAPVNINKDVLWGSGFNTNLAADIWTPRASVYLDGNGPSASGVASVRVGLYTTTSGAPNVLLAESEPVLVNAGQAAGWVDFDFRIPARIPAGTSYWLQFIVDKPNHVRAWQISRPGQGVSLPRVYAQGLPDPWPVSPPVWTSTNVTYAGYIQGAPTATLGGYICYANDLFDTEAVDDFGCDSGMPGPDFYFESKKFAAGDSLRKKLFKQLALYYACQGGSLKLDTVVGLIDSGKTSTTVFPPSTPTWDSTRVTYATWDALRQGTSTWDTLVSAVFKPKRLKFLKRSTHLAFRLYQSSALMPKLRLGPYQIGYKLQRPGRI
jgi:hypothetical protein